MGVSEEEWGGFEKNPIASAIAIFMFMVEIFMLMVEMMIGGKFIFFGRSVSPFTV